MSDQAMSDQAMSDQAMSEQAMSEPGRRRAKANRMACGYRPYGNVIRLFMDALTDGTTRSRDNAA